MDKVENDLSVEGLLRRLGYALIERQDAVRQEGNVIFAPSVLTLPHFAWHELGHALTYLGDEHPRVPRSNWSPAPAWLEALKLTEQDADKYADAFAQFLADALGLQAPGTRSVLDERRALFGRLRPSVYFNLLRHLHGGRMLDSTTSAPLKMASANIDRLLARAEEALLREDWLAAWCEEHHFAFVLPKLLATLRLLDLMRIESPFSTPVMRAQLILWLHHSGNTPDVLMDKHKVRTVIEQFCNWSLDRRHEWERETRGVRSDVLFLGWLVQWVHRYAEEGLSTEDGAGDHLSRAVIASATGFGGAVLWYAGDAMRCEIDEVGPTHLSDLGLDEAPHGISVWEGVYVREDNSIDANMEPSGSFRQPTEDEWLAIRAGKNPWQA